MGILWLDRHMNARQMEGKRTAIGAALPGTGARRHWVSFVGIGFDRRNGLLDILKRQRELIRIELLRTPAKLKALQLL